MVLIMARILDRWIRITWISQCKVIRTVPRRRWSFNKSQTLPTPMIINIYCDSTFSINSHLPARMTLPLCPIRMETQHFPSWDTQDKVFNRWEEKPNPKNPYRKSLPSGVVSENEGCLKASFRRVARTEDSLPQQCEGHPDGEILLCFPWSQHATHPSRKLISC